MSGKAFLFDSFENRYVFRGTLRLMTPLHIGVGLVYEPIGSDAPVAKDASGKPFIPGSSLKGSLRSHLERIINALGSNSIWSCDIFDRPCISEEEDPQLIYDKSCSICRLFGSLYLASKVYINDLAVKEWIGHFEIKDGVGLDRDTGVAKIGVKFDLEVVPSGTAFEFELIAENATDEDLELLALGLREMEEGNIRLGGSKSRGLGYCRLENLSIGRVKREELLNFLSTRKLTPIDDKDGFIKEKVEKLIERVKRDVEEIAK